MRVYLEHLVQREKRMLESNDGSVVSRAFRIHWADTAKSKLSLWNF